MSLLSCRGLTRAWGAFRAVDGVDLDLAEREICAVIGPNGAGKSTLFAMIAGNLRKTAGTVLLGGEDVSALPAHAMAARGVARSFQITAICPELTALENVRLGVQARERARVGGGWAADSPRPFPAAPAPPSPLQRVFPSVHPRRSSELLTRALDASS